MILCVGSCRDTPGRLSKITRLLQNQWNISSFAGHHWNKWNKEWMPLNLWMKRRQKPKCILWIICHRWNQVVRLLWWHFLWMRLTQDDSDATCGFTVAEHSDGQYNAMKGKCLWLKELLDTVDVKRCQIFLLIKIFWRREVLLSVQFISRKRKTSERQSHKSH